MDIILWLDSIKGRCQKRARNTDNWSKGLKCIVGSLKTSFLFEWVARARISWCTAQPVKVVWWVKPPRLTTERLIFSHHTSLRYYCRYAAFPSSNDDPKLTPMKKLRRLIVTWTFFSRIRLSWAHAYWHPFLTLSLRAEYIVSKHSNIFPDLESESHRL